MPRCRILSLVQARYSRPLPAFRYPARWGRVANEQEACSLKKQSLLLLRACSRGSCCAKQACVLAPDEGADRRNPCSRKTLLEAACLHAVAPEELAAHRAEKEIAQLLVALGGFVSVYFRRSDCEARACGLVCNKRLRHSRYHAAALQAPAVCMPVCQVLEGVDLFVFNDTVEGPRAPAGHEWSCFGCGYA